jgi:hypothetical protein
MKAIFPAVELPRGTRRHAVLVVALLFGLAFSMAEIRHCAATFRREVSGRRRPRLPAVFPGKWRPKNGPHDGDHESDTEVCGPSALSHRGRAVNHRKRECLYGNGRHARHRARSRRLRDDAQQGAALVHLHREGRMPDVRNVRSRLRHRLDQAQQIADLHLTETKLRPEKRRQVRRTPKAHLASACKTLFPTFGHL